MSPIFTLIRPPPPSGWAPSPDVPFTAHPTGGARGFHAPGGGNINATVNMPAAAKITYKATGTISASAVGTLSNTATATVPNGVVDPIAANNTATDTDTL